MNNDGNQAGDSKNLEDFVASLSRVRNSPCTGRAQFLNTASWKRAATSSHVQLLPFAAHQPFPGTFIALRDQRVAMTGT